MGKITHPEYRYDRPTTGNRKQYDTRRNSFVFFERKCDGLRERYKPDRGKFQHVRELFEVRADCFENIALRSQVDAGHAEYGFGNRFCYPDLVFGSGK